MSTLPFGFLEGTGFERIDAVPSTISPQLMSMSSSCRFHSAELVASLSEGEGAQP